MRLFLIILASLSAGPALAQDYVSLRGFALMPVPSPNVPQATYTLVEAGKSGGTRLQFISQRAGPSGIGYTRREINYRSGIGRTLASSEVVAGLKRGTRFGGRRASVGVERSADFGGGVPRYRVLVLKFCHLIPAAKERL